MPNRDYHNQRRDYNAPGLSKSQLNPSPFLQFTQWMKEAIASPIQDATAMSLATVDASGQPHNRIVLLKETTSEGFIFYTHYDSDKGHEINQNQRAAMLFFWPELDRQVRIEGTLSKVSPTTSKAYFESRPKDSQLAALSSKQSQPVANRATLEEHFKYNAQMYSDCTVPYPEHWGGYILSPHKFEFWQGRPNRLHDRFIYTPNHATPAQWDIQRLAP